MPRRCHHHLTRTNRAACDVDVDQPRVLARTLAMVGRSHSRGFPEAERSLAQLVMQLLVCHPCANATNSEGNRDSAEVRHPSSRLWPSS